MAQTVAAPYTGSTLPAAAHLQAAAAGAAADAYTMAEQLLPQPPSHDNTQTKWIYRHFQQTAQSEHDSHSDVDIDRFFVGNSKLSKGLNLLQSPSQTHRGDQAGSVQRGCVVWRARRLGRAGSRLGRTAGCVGRVVWRAGLSEGKGYSK